MTMKENGEKVRRKLPKIQTTHLIMGLLVLTTFLTAGMFTFHLGVWDLQREQVSKIEQQAQDLANILSAIDKNTKQQTIDQKARSQLATTERLFTIDQTLEVKKLVTQLGQNLTKVIHNIEEEFRNHTQQVKQHDQSLKGLIENPPSNKTAQAQAVKDIEDIKAMLNNLTQ